jgi:signal transduction histidine kinase
MRGKYSDQELSLDSLSGLVFKEGKTRIIHDVEENKKLEDGDPNKLPFYDYDARIKAEVVIPLKIKEGEEEEKVIGTLAIDSVIKNDFQDIDLGFHETIAGFLATAIHNQRLYEERARMQEELSRVDRTNEISIFLNAFFHDFKNPLSEINAAINLIEMTLHDPDSAKTYINKIRELSKRMFSVYDEYVKDFSKTARKRETVEIDKLIQNSLKTVERTRGLAINLKGNYNDAHHKLDCYPVFIELAFRSIIGNAVKFSEKLELENQYLDITTNFDESKDLIAVIFESSTIEQIPVDKLKSIFKPFVQVTDGSPGTGGTGLGLAVADLCIKLHGGNIKAENVRDKKAVRFTITLALKGESVKGDSQ